MSKTSAEYDPSENGGGRLVHLELVYFPKFDILKIFRGLGIIKWAQISSNVSITLFPLNLHFLNFDEEDTPKKKKKKKKKKNISFSL